MKPVIIAIVEPAFTIDGKTEKASFPLFFAQIKNTGLLSNRAVANPHPLPA